MGKYTIFTYKIVNLIISKWLYFFSARISDISSKKYSDTFSGYKNERPKHYCYCFPSGLLDLYILIDAWYWIFQYQHCPKWNLQVKILIYGQILVKIAYNNFFFRNPIIDVSTNENSKLRPKYKRLYCRVHSHRFHHSLTTGMVIKFPLVLLYVYLSFTMMLPNLLINDITRRKQVFYFIFNFIKHIDIVPYLLSWWVLHPSIA